MQAGKTKVPDLIVELDCPVEPELEFLDRQLRDLDETIQQIEWGKHRDPESQQNPVAESLAFSRWPSLEEVPAVIDQATQLLVDEFDPLQVILFGSYARGDANEASDIDLLVVVPDEIQGTRSELNIRGGSCLWDMPMPIDLIVQRYSLVKKGQEIPESVLSTIKAQGKVLYERFGQTQSTLD